MPLPLTLTTPIYYINGDPHLGHAYTTILGDALARSARLEGREVFFVTGTDEHGLKTLQTAREQGLPPQEYADRVSARFQAVWGNLHIATDDFIRTTQPRHAAVVRRALNDLWRKGEIYKGEYSGWYCVPDERFFTEREVTEARCPECGRPVERIAEPDYFFRMSAYQDWLIDHIQSHPGFIQPENRRNEVLGFLRRPLGDLCISRPCSRLDWGIPLPFDPNFVTYIWFDALLNYLTAAESVPERFEARWSGLTHLMGKDILTTHAVYWPIMLHALGLEQPRAIFAHGWWVIGGRKMGKSLGNAVRPMDCAALYGADAFRYFLLRDMTPGQDAEFLPERLAARYQTDLANTFGNLLQRLTSMIARYCGGKMPEPVGGGMAEAVLRDRFEQLPGAFFAQTHAFALNQAYALVMDALAACNQYLEESAPWREAAAGNRGAVNTALYTSCEALRIASGLLCTAMPFQAREALRRLGALPVQALHDLEWGALLPGQPVLCAEPLFPRIAAQ